MKELLSILLAMLLSIPFTSIESTSETFEASAAAPWYELSGDDTLLTVWLSDNTDDALSWQFEISNPEALELLTQEIISDEPEYSVLSDEPNNSNSSMTYAASFAGFGSAESNVSLILKYAAEDAAPPFATRVLEMSISADHRISILSVLERELTANWIEYDAEHRILTVTLPEQSGNGYAWDMSILDPEILELITCDTETGYIGSYKAAMGDAGSVELTLSYGESDSDKPEIIYTVNMIVNESGDIEVCWTEIFIISDSTEAYIGE